MAKSTIDFPILKLIRMAEMPFGTFGMIGMPDGQHLTTVELPWIDNKKGLSCIPPGEYMCAPRPYHRGGYDAVEITDVPNRKHILFHIANVPQDVKGCIGIGTNFGYVKGSWAVTSSRKAFNEFMRQVGGKTFILVIS